MNKILISIISIIIFTSTFFISSCSDDFLNTRPDGIITNEELQDSENALLGQINGMYSFLVSFNTLERASTRHDDFGHTSQMLASDLMNNDMLQVSGSYNWFWNDYQMNNRQSNYSTPLKTWKFYYKVISNSNSVLANIDYQTATGNSRYYLGQAYALRAWAYYYLAQFFQQTYIGNENAPGVPMVTEKTTFEQLSDNDRAPLKDVYTLIVSDLKIAIELLNGYNRPSKAYIDMSVACGLLARVYLCMEDWDNTSKYADLALENSSTQLMDTTQYLSGFNDINNIEWMWGADITTETPSTTTGIVNLFSHLGTNNYGYANMTGMYKAMDRKLYDLIPEKDIRKKCFKSPSQKCINTKFGPYGDGNTNAQDYLYMRRSEMLLIKAEALAMSGKDGADPLYDLVITRNPDYVKSTKTGTELRDEIYLQRRIELWGEGFSLFDHKRLKMGVNRDYPDSNHPIKLVVASGNKLFMYQIPDAEMDANKGITTQNE